MAVALRLRFGESLAWLPTPQDERAALLICCDIARVFEVWGVLGLSIPACHDIRAT